MKIINNIAYTNTDFHCVRRRASLYFLIFAQECTTYIFLLLQVLSCNKTVAYFTKKTFRYYLCSKPQCKLRSFAFRTIELRNDKISAERSAFLFFIYCFISCKSGWTCSLPNTFPKNRTLSAFWRHYRISPI